MKSFKTYITEEFITEAYDIEILSEDKDDASRAGGVSNNTKGVLHELLTGYHLNGGKHMERHENEHGESPKQAHDRLKSVIHKDDYSKINANAKSAAAHIRAHLKTTHPDNEIAHVVHTSKAGDTQKETGVKASQKEDSSDIYIGSKNKKTGKLSKHGISLKVSDNSSKNVPSSSLGMKSSGSKGQSLYNTHQKNIKTKHPELVGKNKDARKQWARENPEKHNEIKTENKKLLNRVAHHHAAELQHKLDSGDHAEVVHHIREVLHAHQTPAESAGAATFGKHTTYMTAKGVQHEHSHPGHDYEHILKDHKNITAKASGVSVHFYHKGKKFATQSHKLDSQSDPLSGLKSAGKSV